MTEKLTDLRARLGAWPRSRLDRLLAAALVAVTAAEVLLIDAETGDRVVAITAALLLAAGILTRRRSRLGSMALGAVALVLVGFVAESVVENLQGPWLAWIFLVYALSVRADRRTLAAGLAIGTAGMTISGVVSTGEPLENIFFGLVFGVVAPAIAGRLMRGRIRLNDALRDKAAQLEREAAVAEEDAVARERRRIAGELHDVIADALVAMTRNAAIARGLTRSDQPRAASTFEAIEETGRDALAELRRLLDMLKPAGEAVALTPQPTLAHLESLVARTRAAGLSVVLRVEGASDGALPPGVDLTGYRVVQEALAEAAAEGGAASAIVRVCFHAGEIDIEVIDDGARGARRMLGMRERVRVCGGQLDAGPRRQGGHAVHARLPVQEVVS